MDLYLSLHELSYTPEPNSIHDTTKWPSPCREARQFVPLREGPEGQMASRYTGRDCSLPAWLNCSFPRSMIVATGVVQIIKLQVEQLFFIPVKSV